MITLLIVLLVVAAIISILWTVHRQDELDDREAELEAQSLSLDERANRIAADEETLRSEWKCLQQASEMILKSSPSGDGG